MEAAELEQKRAERALLAKGQIEIEKKRSEIDNNIEWAEKIAKRMMNDADGKHSNTIYISCHRDAIGVFWSMRLNSLTNRTRDISLLNVMFLVRELLIQLRKLGSKETLFNWPGIHSISDLKKVITNNLEEYNDHHNPFKYSAEMWEEKAFKAMTKKKEK